MASVVTAGTHKVSSVRLAEAAKVIENIQRDVNIALVNELAMLFKDSWPRHARGARRRRHQMEFSRLIVPASSAATASASTPII
jgi:hypothetical protein